MKIVVFNAYLMKSVLFTIYMYYLNLFEFNLDKMAK